MDKKQSKYSDYRLGKVDIETEKAFHALIDGFTDNPIWIPRSVVDPEPNSLNNGSLTRRIRN